MKWLQWSKADFAHGVGGLETHGRCLHRELEKKGIESFISNDPNDLLGGNWDVIHTHGGEPSFSLNLKAHMRNKKATWIHTLHGSTLERMWACGEYFWPGGYSAFSREMAGVLGADIIFSVRPDILGLDSISKIKKVVICSNGWDSWVDSESSLKKLPLENLKSFSPFWLFVGRGSDVVKGTWQIEEILKANPELKLVVAPGEGFKDHPQILKMGIVNSEGVRELLKISQGLFLTSLYEGLPIVVLEALGQGVPVVATKVGGLKTLSPDLKGMYFSSKVSPLEIEKAWKVALVESAQSNGDRKKVQEHNQKILLTWNQVAQIYLDSVQKFKK